jgi:ATP-binding cassette, subfamily F, member 3
MITLNNVTKFYGKKTLFSNISLSINRGEKIGLVGPNGAGKSTLFGLIMGAIEPSNGTVSQIKNIRIGYLAQETHFESKHTVLDELLEGDPQIQQLKVEKEKLEHEGTAGTHRYGEVMHELEVLGFFEMEHKAKKVLSGLGFKERDFNRPITELSGGWQMRTLLARLLTCHYDILLLDEPTNYLDLNAALWFKDFLADFKGTFVMISHDKAFLNEVTNYTIILEQGAIVKVHGNYEQYKKIRDEKMLHLVKQYKQQQKDIAQMQEFIDRFHAQPNKAAQVRSKKHMLERMDVIELPEEFQESMSEFKFPPVKRSGHKVCALNKVSKAYGDLKVYQDFDFEITQGEKAVLVGENGAGKSTLLKIIAGVIDADSGQRMIGHNVDLGYFSQTRMDVLNPHHTVLEEAASASNNNLGGEKIRTILGAFLFRGDDVNKKVTVLSGGEKSRLILVKLLLNPPNFLLLDEPTTHLDVDAVDALIKALNQYEGTLVCISHDIHFVRSAANIVYEVEYGKVRKFFGNFDYYLQKKAQNDFKDVTLKVAKSKDLNVSGQESPDLSKQENNEKLSKKIKKLRKEKEKIETDLAAKKMVVENSRHGEDVIKYYRELIGQMDKRLIEIEVEIAKTKSQFLQ